MQTTTPHRVNPSSWSARLGFDQGRVVTAPSQLALTLANIAQVLAEAGMGWSDVVQLRCYTTDLERLLDVYDTLVEHLGEEGVRPPSTIVEVSRLLVPGMTVTIDGLAAR